jgi:hypothetical protein
MEFRARLIPEDIFERLNEKRRRARADPAQAGR